jgi:N6-adenosine-specific RNA methylase IME4
MKNPNPPLVRFEAAKKALAAAYRVDEVKSIRDKAIAAAAYARQAKDRELIEHATEIRLRAEIKAGKLLRNLAATGGRQKSGDSNQHARSPKVTLQSMGITKQQSSRWQQKAALDEPAQEALIARSKRKAVDAVDAAATPGMKAERRATREAELADKIGAFPDRRYGVIYADPPWRFEVYSRDSGMDRSAENHYPTMTPEEIMAVPVHALAAPDCVLFLWTTVPLLAVSFDVLEQWGFQYRSCMIWVKDKVGLGLWFRNRHELLLVAIRGRVPAPDPAHRPDSVIEAPRGEHSAKPPLVRQLIEDMFPNLPRLEMFARETAPGWDSWGNEVPATEPAGEFSEPEAPEVAPPP